MKKLKGIQGTTPLTSMELQIIEGGDGTSAPPRSFWAVAGSYGELLLKGLVIFSTEGGKNAGLVVH